MKKMLVIMLAVIMALSTAACGTVQPTTQTTPAPAVEVKPEVTPAPEVSEPEPTEAPKEEPEATEVVEETPEVTEEVEQNHDEEFDDLAFLMEGAPKIVDGIDFTPYYNNEANFFSIVEENANYDEPKVFVRSNRGVEMILSNGDSINERLVEKMEYTYWYYIPEKVVSSEAISDNTILAGPSTYSIPPTSKFADVGALKLSVTGKDIPVSVKFVYEDGTEETVTIYVTRDN